jgi:two-component system nitrate/nitrite response regulator NarL
MIGTMSDRPNKRLMIVDDHPEMRRALRDLLWSAASEICECTSGEEAVRRCGEFKPDFITMDYNMGTMNGLEAAQAVRAQLPDATIVIVTASDSSALRREALRAQADACIAKDNLVLLRQFFVEGGAPGTIGINHA